MKQQLMILLFLMCTVNIFAQPKIKAGEYFLGTVDPGNGNGTSFSVVDGVWDNVVENIIATAQTLSSTTSPILINIRLKDNSNNWGPLFKKTLFFNAENTNSRSVNITSAEYFIGLFDPGQGQGTPIIAFDGALDEAVETVLRTSATWTVSTGPTLFNIRLRDAYNNWGPLFKKTIFPYGANTNVKLIKEVGPITVCKNSSVTLSYIGPNGFTPTWFNDSTNSTITFTPASVGYYGVSATLGNITYVDSIYIDFLPTPTPTINPAGSILVCGSSVITLSTESTPNTTFQWYLNNTPISGATSANYIPTEVGSYYVEATSTLNSCIGNSLPTTLFTVASISPSGSVASCTSSVVLSTQSGSGNTYQWKLNGVNIPEATSSTYNATSSGAYSVTITNGECVSTSANTTVTINDTPTKPTINASGATTFCSGGSVTLTSSSATGNTWSNGATTQSIVVTESGDYSVTVSNGTCSATSSTLSVHVEAGQKITSQPSNQTANASGTAQFVIISSNTNSTYQWQTDLGVGFQNISNGGLYSGATTNTLIISNLTLNNNNQQFRCIITSGSCSETSNLALLTVIDNTGINEQSVDTLFSIFPNPANNNYITIKADQKLIGSVYSIYDILGKSVLTGKIVSENSKIEINGLSSGLYLIKIEGNYNKTLIIGKE